MPRSRRRTLSWLAVLALAALATLGLTALPGWSGLGDELHWLLAHAPRAREMNRATQLLVLADARAPGSTPRYLASLLQSPDPAVVQHTRSIILNMGRTRSPLGQSWLQVLAEQSAGAQPEGL